MRFIMNFFQNMFLKKTTFFLPKIASVTLHIPKEFWWHLIFGSATILVYLEPVGGRVHGEVS